MSFLPSQAFFQFQKHSGLAFVFALCMYFFAGGFVIALIPLWLGWGGFSEMTIDEKLILTAVFSFFILLLLFLKKWVFSQNQVIVTDKGFYLMSKGHERMKILKDDVWFFVVYPALIGINKLSFEEENPNFVETHFSALLSSLKEEKSLGLAIKPRDENMERALKPRYDIKGELTYYLESMRGIVNEESKAKAIKLSGSAIASGFLYFDLREGMLEWLAAHYPDTQVMVYKKSLKKVG